MATTISGSAIGSSSARRMDWTGLLARLGRATAPQRQSTSTATATKTFYEANPTAAATASPATSMVFWVIPRVWRPRRTGCRGRSAGDSVSAGGDVNADGFDDILVSRRIGYLSDPQTLAFYGTAAGLRETRVLTRHTVQPPAIDGNLSDWAPAAGFTLDRTSAETLSGLAPQPDDASASLRTAWTLTDLYLALHVADDVIVNDSGDVWRDDEVELAFYAVLRRQPGRRRHPPVHRQRRWPHHRLRRAGPAHRGRGAGRPGRLERGGAHPVQHPLRLLQPPGRRPGLLVQPRPARRRRWRQLGQLPGLAGHGHDRRRGLRRDVPHHGRRCHPANPHAGHAGRHSVADGHIDANPYRHADRFGFADADHDLDGDANSNTNGYRDVDRNAHANADDNAISHGDIDASRAPSLPAADPAAVAAAAGLPSARPAAGSPVPLLKFGTGLGKEADLCPSNASRSVFLLVVALLVPGVILAQPAGPQAAAVPSAPTGSTLFVENAGQWPDAARFQVWGSPAGVGTTWLADDAIWIRSCRWHSRRWQVRKRSPAQPARKPGEGPADCATCHSDRPQTHLPRRQPGRPNPAAQPADHHRQLLPGQRCSPVARRGSGVRRRALCRSVPGRRPGAGPSGRLLAAGGRTGRNDRSGANPSRRRFGRGCGRRRAAPGC